MSTTTPTRLAATWFDGTSAKAQPCELAWQDGVLLLQVGELTSKRYALQTVVWPERTRHGKRQLLLPDGGVVSLPSSSAWDNWAQAAGLAQPLAARWALSWRAVAGAGVLLVGLGFGAWRWGIPWGAQAVARWVPEQVQNKIGQSVLSDLEARGWLRSSELPPDAQQRIQEAAAHMLRQAYSPLPKYKLHLREAPSWMGPNAFALPSGDVVVTDALVLLLQTASATVSPARLGVVAHEMGHVQHQHGLRALLELGALSALAGWWVGDYSSLLASTPALFAQAGYSRDHERDADLEAVRVMRAAGINPAVMAEFFKKAQSQTPQRDPDRPRFGLASHPSDAERIQFFEQAALK